MARKNPINTLCPTDTYNCSHCKFIRDELASRLRTKRSFKMAMKITKDVELAKDLVQLMNERILSRPHLYKDGNLNGFLSVTMQRIFYNQLRSMKRESSLNGLHEHTQEGLLSGVTWENARTKSPTTSLKDQNDHSSTISDEHTVKCDQTHNDSQSHTHVLKANVKKPYRRSRSQCTGVMSQHIRGQSSETQNPEQMILIRQMYETLSASDRELFLLLYQGMKHREIASVLGLNLNTCHGRVRRMMTRLRDRFSA